MSSKINVPGEIYISTPIGHLQIVMTGPRRGIYAFDRETQKTHKSMIPIRLNKMNDGCYRYADHRAKSVFNMLLAWIGDEERPKKGSIRGIAFALWNKAIASADQQELKFRRKRGITNISLAAYDAKYCSLKSNTEEIRLGEKYFLLLRNIERYCPTARRPVKSMNWKNAVKLVAAATEIGDRFNNLMIRLAKETGWVSEIIQLARCQDSGALLSPRAHALYARLGVEAGLGRVYAYCFGSVTNAVFLASQDEWQGLLRDTVWAITYGVTRVERDEYFARMANIRTRQALVELHDEVQTIFEKRLGESYKGEAWTYWKNTRDQASLMESHKKARAEVCLKDTAKVRVLKSKEEMFAEGEAMEHCVGRNYGHMFEYDIYLHVDGPDGGATAQLLWAGTGWKENQFYGRKNSMVKREHLLSLEEWRLVNNISDGDKVLSGHCYASSSYERDHIVAMLWCPEPPNGDKRALEEIL